MIYTAYGNRINKNDRAQEWQINGQSRAFKPRTMSLLLPKTHYINESTRTNDEGVLNGLPHPSYLTNRKNYIYSPGDSNIEVLGSSEERCDHFALPRVFSKINNLKDKSRLTGYYELDEINQRFNIGGQQTFYINQG
jgi:hypothetical protein